MEIGSPVEMIPKRRNGVDPKISSEVTAAIREARLKENQWLELKFTDNAEMTKFRSHLIYLGYKVSVRSSRNEEEGGSLFVTNK